MNTVSDEVAMNSLAYLSLQKRFTEDVFYYVKIWPKTPISNQHSLVACQP